MAKKSTKKAVKKTTKPDPIATSEPPKASIPDKIEGFANGLVKILVSKSHRKRSPVSITTLSVGTKVYAHNHDTIEGELRVSGRPSIVVKSTNLGERLKHQQEGQRQLDTLSDSYDETMEPAANPLDEIEAQKARDLAVHAEIEALKKKIDDIEGSAS